MARLWKIRSAPADSVVSRLFPLVTGLAALYLVLILVLGFFEQAKIPLPFSILSLGTLVVLILIRYLASRASVPSAWLESAGTLAAGLVIINTIVYLYLTSGYRETINLIMLGSGILCFFLSSRRLSLVLLVSMLVWVLVEVFWDSTTAWLYYAFGLFAAAGMKLPAEFRKDEAKRTWEKLQKSEERYALAAQGSNDGLWDWDLETDAISYSPRWATMIGSEHEELVESSLKWFDRCHPDDLRGLKSSIEAHLEADTPHLEHEYRIRRNDGSYLWILTRGVAVQGEEGKAYRMAGSHSDIAERKKHEQLLLHDASHDPLSGLANRLLFLENVEHALANVRRRSKYTFAVLFADLDRFKLINDSLGHLAGDELLKETAKRLTDCLRSSDIVARFGGDEFAILLEDISNPADATRAAERIRLALEEKFEIGGRDVFTSASIGIVLSNEQYKYPEELLRDVDTAMYRAKQAGGARFEIFDREMHQNVMLALQLEMGLRLALEREEFLLYYQPILSLKTGKIIAAEALIRWQHPEDGLLPPGAFLKAAEESGLILPIGSWVLKQACQDAKRWGQAIGLPEGLPVNVNISARQFAQAEFLDRVKLALKEAALQPSELRLEITEDSVMKTGSEASTKLEVLRKAGIRVYLDDFGTGYSSLSYLHELPIDGIKIDRSFTSQLEKEEIQGISQAILQMATILELEVTAEGVENSRQLELLEAQGYPSAQGYYFSKPMSQEDFESYLSSQK